MAETDSSREYRHVSSSAVKEYRERVNNDPEDEKDISHDVAEKYGIPKKDLRFRAAAGA